MSAFLEEFQPRPLAQTADGLRPTALYIGPGQLGLEVAVYTATTKPASASLMKAWKDRRGGRSTPLLVVALHAGKAWLCGPSGEDLPIHAAKDVGSIERLCAAALKQPDRHAALLFLAQALPSLDTVAPGLRNEGLFALHELTGDAPSRSDWQQHAQRAQSALQDGAEGQDLLRRLGYTVERLDNMTHILRGADRRLALAVLLDRTEVPEAGSPKFNNLSPISYAFHKADSENLDWVLVLQGDRLRLYPARPGIGVGRRGRTETYLELQTSLLADHHLAFLSLIFSADALKPDGTVHKLLKDSARFASNLADRLRDRIYDQVMPLLANGVASARDIPNPTVEDLALTYRMALTVLFRLLFVAYAEDRDLLPYQHSEAYRHRSLKQKAQELAEHTRNLKPVAPGASHWLEVTRIWTAIAIGDVELSVPPYNGGLFTSDPAVSPAGATLARLQLPNEVFELALRSLLLTDVGDGPLQPVDFRSLGVREFGTIYEGLLESELSVADQDLDLDSKGSYVPSKGRQAPVVVKGQIYLHDRSGARKATGSYFTKSFAVEHLLDCALAPALEAHLSRVSNLDEVDAAEAFFDFRVADIAMGSGHFLVAAVDRIEKHLADYLAKDGARGAAGVRAELARLKEAAKRQLGDLATEMVFEDSQLLRRLIARRCIYGVDLNPLSVELARLAIWIHTFVPGLPLSVLDHNLVHGNALIGVGTVAEIREAFEAASTALFPVDADNLLGRAEQPLRRLANISDATLADVGHARDAMEEAKVAVSDTKALCDIIAAHRLDAEIKYQFENWEKDRKRIGAHPARHRAVKALEGLNAFHFPIAFPEVFLRTRSGFDVLLGNPPWQEATIEDHAFWARYFPGLRGLPQPEMERERGRLRLARPDLAAELDNEISAMAKVRKALTSGAFPGMGTGDPDLYKAFMWRFWNLANERGGRIGVVLPRSAFAAKGSELFRRAMFELAASVDLTMLVNNRKWVFDEVHPQYTIGLSAIARGRPNGKTVNLRGPFASLAAFEIGRHTAPASFTAAEILTWNDTASLPLLPDERSLEVFAQLRRAPRLDLNDGKSWRARPDAELHATAQKPLMSFEMNPPQNYWPVFKGESFDLWEPDKGAKSYYAWAEPAATIDWLYAKRLRSGGSSRDSVHGEFSLEFRQDKRTLAFHVPRIVVRDVSRATDTRTIRAALIPSRVFVANTAPHLLWPRGDERDQAFLLGVLSSRPLDWYARRYVETHVNYFVFNPLPIPRPQRTDPLWRHAVALAGRLASPDDRFADWAKKVGVEHGPLAPDRKLAIIDELDAVVAHLYGLSEDQLQHIFETFHEGWDWEPRFDAVVMHFRNTPKGDGGNRSGGHSIQEG
ncbi:MAG: hypothetical protein E5Y73_11085 [Mesorhizobium sp.]|uniref:Eco57I restriction-modification methylase domain-containing protein n=1 Tax=Mesorhizobium sp. TaxID=1871066 RepID=UPI00121FAA0A|nr:hypothetical protein [Mesorhizobium sp.]TIL94647.1 MAG: hypothetical protein E5Y73_11085 [Mesorhizobium sp.]